MQESLVPGGRFRGVVLVFGLFSSKDEVYDLKTSDVGKLLEWNVIERDEIGDLGKE